MVAQKQMSLGSVIFMLVQILYNIIQFSLPDMAQILMNHPTYMLLLVVGVNSFLSIIQVLFHIDAKDLDTIKQGLMNLMKDNANKQLTTDDLKAIETEGSYWLQKGIKYLTDISIKKDTSTSPTREKSTTLFGSGKNREC